MPDTRRAEGRRHPLAFILALAACAVLAGAKSLAAITEWAADVSPAVLTVLGGPGREPSGPTPPAEATVRRVLQRVDGDALDTAIGTWLAARDPGRPRPGQDRARHPVTLWPWTARPCAAPVAPTAPRSTCSPR
ncbi:transposase family protein [Streptomyces sp. PA03-2a]|uniref:transposase family protein n=1 Tax=Streptomyces sp. PA03-2a TaxID=3028701 RepID=UPI0029BBEA4F|nr:transposase family protein [Streptomyces sp. PA03-2a]MDX2732954.1 transposase family protein [Streptomyces sp. PA03-2a]